MREGIAASMRARALVGEQDDLDPDLAGDLRTLDGQLAILGGLMRERLAEPGPTLGREEIVALSQALAEVHTVRFSIHDHVGHERLRRLDELDRGLQGLRRTTDQDELLDIVCEVVSRCCGFDRVMLSRVDDDLWRPWRSYATVDGDAERAFREWIREVPQIHLQHMLLESEMVRRREAALVKDGKSDPRVYGPLVASSGLTSYVAAPIMSDQRVIGLLHADHRDRDVSDLDRDVLWAFAVGFAQIFERAVLLARLRDQRAEVVQLMKTVETVLDDLASAEIDLATREQTTVLGASRPVRPSATDQTPAFGGVLTSRELEVLSLMSTGATNDRIAQRLVIANGTVKSHVKAILRKLRVENRAEAISQYLRLTIGSRED
jgi:DNA-binding CsgD family transcriptional regulator